MRQNPSAFIRGTSVTFDGDRHTRTRRGCKKVTFAFHQAGRARQRISKSEAATAGAQKRHQRRFRRLRGIKVDAERAGQRFITVDQHQMLTMLVAQVSNPAVRHAGKNDRGVGAEVNCLLQRG